MNYSLLIKGFKTQAQAQAFYDWYEGQGEQSACVWFEELAHNDELDVDSMLVDMSKPPKWKDSVLEMTVKPQ